VCAEWTKNLKQNSVADEVESRARCCGEWAITAEHKEDLAKNLEITIATLL
jgi:hypothetical protein